MSAFDSIITLRDVGPPSLCDILRAVSRVTGISVKNMTSPRRTTSYAQARQVYFYLACEFTGKSLPQIGIHCGDRDHTTVLYGFHRVRDNPHLYEPALSKAVDELMRSHHGTLEINGFLQARAMTSAAA